MKHIDFDEMFTEIRNWLSECERGDDTKTPATTPMVLNAETCIQQLLPSRDKEKCEIPESQGGIFGGGFHLMRPDWIVLTI